MSARRERYSPFLFNFAKITGALSAFVYFKPRVFYESGAHSSKKGGIVISNHTAMIDYVLMLTIFPLKVIRYMIAEIVFAKNRLLSWFLYRMGGIRVDRENAVDAGCISRIDEAVKKGHLIGIFPEGRLNRTPEEGLLEFKSGAAYFALRHGLPVIPVYHQYKYGIFRRTCVIIGDPIDIKSLFPGEIDSELLKDAAAYLRERIIELEELLEKRIAEAEEKRRARPLYRAVSVFVRSTMKPFLMLFFRPKYYYADKAVQGRILPEPSIVVSNHTNYFDPPMICSVFGKNMIHMIAGEILYDIPILHWLLPHCGCIKVDRNSIDMDSYRNMINTLDKGECIGLFPEGGINEATELLPFKSGMVLAAMKTGAPIIPVYIDGNYKIFGKRLRIVIDKPYEFDTDAKITGEFLDATAEGIRLRMTELKNMLNKETKDV